MPNISTPRKITAYVDSLAPKSPNRRSEAPTDIRVNIKEKKVSGFITFLSRYLPMKEKNNPVKAIKTTML